MQKAAMYHGTSCGSTRPGGDALAPSTDSSPPPRVSPPPSEAAATAATSATALRPSTTAPVEAAGAARAAVTQPAAAAAAGAKRPKSTDPQRVSLAQAAANCARLHHIAMWRHRWLGYGWGETAGLAARGKNSGKRNHKKEIMKELLRQIDQNKIAETKQKRRRNYHNRSGSPITVQRLYSSGHTNPHNHQFMRGEKVMSAIYRQNNYYNPSRPQTQHRNRVENISPSQPQQRSSSNAQVSKETQHQSRKERTSQSYQRVHSISTVGTDSHQPNGREKSRSKQRRGSMNNADSSHLRQDSRNASPAHSRHHSSNNSPAGTHSRINTVKICSSNPQTTPGISRTSSRREKSTSKGRKSGEASASISLQCVCKKENATKHNKHRSNEISEAVKQATQRGRDDVSKSVFSPKRNRSSSMESPPQPLRRNRNEITSAPYPQSSHPTSLSKRSRRESCSDASESTEPRSNVCSRAYSDSRLQDRSPDTQPSAGRLRERDNIATMLNQIKAYYCNKTSTPSTIDVRHENVAKVQPWEYRTSTRFRSSWSRLRRPCVISATTHTIRRRHNINVENIACKPSCVEVSVKTDSPRCNLGNASRTTQSQKRNREWSNTSSSRGVADTASTSQSHPPTYNWANIPPSPRVRSPTTALRSHLKPNRHDHGSFCLISHNSPRASEVRKNRLNSVTPRPSCSRQLKQFTTEVHSGLNITSRATQTRPERFGRSSQLCLHSRDAAVMTKQPKLWRLDTGTAMPPPAMKEDASSLATLPTAVDLSLSIFLQILRQPLVAAATAAASPSNNAPETQSSAAVGAGDSDVPAPSAALPCKLHEK